MLKLQVLKVDLSHISPTLIHLGDFEARAHLLEIFYELAQLFSKEVELNQATEKLLEQREMEEFEPEEEYDQQQEYEEEEPYQPPRVNYAPSKSNSPKKKVNFSGVETYDEPGDFQYASNYEEPEEHDWTLDTPYNEPASETFMKPKPILKKTISHEEYDSEDPQLLTVSALHKRSADRTPTKQMYVEEYETSDDGHSFLKITPHDSAVERKKKLEIMEMQRQQKTLEESFLREQLADKRKVITKINI
jgi:hypothetical protein